MAESPIPIEAVRDLPTPELAIALLRHLADPDTGQFVDTNIMNHSEQLWFKECEDRPALLVRISDAWAWLVAHGLVGISTRNFDWHQVTTLGHDVLGGEDPLAFVSANTLLPSPINQALRTARLNFAAGDYQTACFAAMKEVEVAVRSASGLGFDLIGTKLMQQAFSVDKGGPLTDAAAEGGEQVATMELFKGAIGTFKNPASHRTVHYNDPIEAAEVILLADLLLRIVDRSKGDQRPPTRS